MKKKEYIKPKANVITINCEGICQTSGSVSRGGWDKLDDEDLE